MAQISPPLPERAIVSSSTSLGDGRPLPVSDSCTAVLSSDSAHSREQKIPGWKGRAALYLFVPPWSLGFGSWGLALS